MDLGIVATYFWVVLVSWLVEPTKSWSKPSCQTAQNIAHMCLLDQVELLRVKSYTIQGHPEVICNSPLSEQTCQLCRAFNESSRCLDVLFESCEYSDIYEYMWTKKLPYLGTIASLCNFNNLVSEIDHNQDCYQGITVNLRQCFSALESEPSCRAASKGYSCSTKMADAYCAALFNRAENHRQLALLYLRVLEPMIDMQNCSRESRLLIAEIYPELQYRWRKPTTIPNSYKKPAQEVVGLYNSAPGRPQANLSSATLVFTLLLLSIVTHVQIT